MNIAQILTLAPKIIPDYRIAFSNGQATIDRHGISMSGLRIAHFIAQVLHESNALIFQFENLSYSAERLVAVWPKRFQPIGPLDPAQFARNPEALANQVYGGRMNNTMPGDGYKFRGRGLLQLTGKENYLTTTNISQSYDANCPNFVMDPDQVASSNWCLEVAAAMWEFKGCNELADQDNLQQIVQTINGGTVGIEDRANWLKKAKAIWCL